MFDYVEHYHGFKGSRPTEKIGIHNSLMGIEPPRSGKVNGILRYVDADSTVVASRLHEKKPVSTPDFQQSTLRRVAAKMSERAPKFLAQYALAAQVIGIAITGFALKVVSGVNDRGIELIGNSDGRESAASATQNRVSPFLKHSSMGRALTADRTRLEDVVGTRIAWAHGAIPTPMFRGWTKQPMRGSLGTAFPPIRGLCSGQSSSTQ